MCVVGPSETTQATLIVIKSFSIHSNVWTNSDLIQYDNFITEV